MGSLDRAQSQRLDTFRDVIIPQAIPPIVPALGNYLVALFKETPLLSAIAVLELMQTAKILGSETFRYTEPITLVGVFFLVISLVSAALIRAARALLLNAEDPMTMNATQPDGPLRQGHQELWRADRARRPRPRRRARARRSPIIGPSGSGKTTVLRMLMTLETINGGVIWVDGEPLTHVEKNGELVPADRAHIRAHPRQDRHGVPALQPLPAHDGAGELHGGADARCSKLPKAEAEERARELLDMVGLGDKQDHYPEPALRRPAAARRHRPRARHAARKSCCSTR